MRKLVSVLLCVILCFSVCSLECSAVATEKVLISRSVETLENGEYIVTELYQTVRALQPLAEGREVQGSKTTKLYSPSNTLLWDLTVEGTFNCISGVSAKATGSNAVLKVYASNVHVVSRSANYSSNTATATGTVSYNSVKKTATVSISCDVHGNLY